MNPPERIRELVDAMRVRGVIAADALLPTDIEESRPWFVAVLQAVAGWLAGICTLVFVVLLFKPESNVAIATLGVALLAAAWPLYYAGRHAVFLDQFAPEACFLLQGSLRQTCRSRF